MSNPFLHFGNRFLRPLLVNGGYGVFLAGQVFVRIPHLFRRRQTFKEQLFLGGIKTLHVSLLVGFFIGMIVSLQVGLELSKYGQQENIGLLVSILMAREMAPFVTAIILAASVGSAMAAELGTMKVQEEITALDVLSVDVVSYLVLPRVIALTLVSPILTLLSVWVGTLGGGVIAVTQLGLDFSGYTHNAMTALQDIGSTIPLPVSLYSGLIKSIVFGFVTAIVSCASGLHATNGAQGVGQTTRSAVRDSIILIIVLNFFLGKFLLH
ncbi:MAG: ABC transporter permease [Planctomycetota bacterium]|nr:ABC transporter permease [Planctomycetota bacterium]